MPDLRRPHGIAGNADDPALLAEQIQRLHGFLGETDDPEGRELAHHRRYAEKYLACHAAFKSIAGLTSQVIASRTFDGDITVVPGCIEDANPE